MKTLILTNVGETLRITCVVDSFEGNLTVLEVEGLTDAAIHSGIDIRQEVYDRAYFVNIAIANNLKLVVQDNNTGSQIIHNTTTTTSTTSAPTTSTTTIG